MPRGLRGQTNRQKGSYGRKDRLIQAKRNDVYERRQKLPEPTYCPSCGAVYIKGRWAWAETPPEAHKALCPACRRIEDHYPAGYIEISGPFFEEHRDELLNLIRNIEKREKAEHPLEKLIAITTEDDQTLVTTTGIHVARRIGEALARSYEGDLAYQYGDGEKTIRVSWRR